MAQVFPRLLVLQLKLWALAALGFVFVVLLAWRISIAPHPAIGTPAEQIVPFSHKHHVGDIGLDCRYCHTAVEQSAFAGIPPTHTCMTCHSELFTQQPMLAPVVQSFASGDSLQWNRIHDLPDFVYFNHSIHVAKGVGCATCHGPVDRMPLTWRVAPLTMQWCLDCHRAPEKYLRPVERVFDMAWRPSGDQLALGRRLVAAYHIHKSSLTDCSTCHR
ncbi:MAG TPA: cytochrome c3 family protein [Casimicrobiaceae bacterium]|nr:cytochrome c3 family protein [Casimicrobiaceae bacterium]